MAEQLELSERVRQGGSIRRCACSGGDRSGGQETGALAAAVRAAIQGRGDSSEQGRVGRRGHSRDPFWRLSQLLLQTDWMWRDQGGRRNRGLEGSPEKRMATHSSILPLRTS